MYNEGNQEFVVDQSLYYPPVTSYGYMCTGFELPSNWDDHHGVFGLDGQDIQYAGAQSESFPYLYYTPGYGYPDSPYNPYNPYIPGAMVGLDGSFIGSQQYYIHSYDTPVSSTTYSPVVTQSRSDVMDGSTKQFIDTSASAAYRGLKHNLSSASPTFTPAPVGPAPGHPKTYSRLSEGSRANAGSGKQPVMHAGIGSGNFAGPAASQVPQSISMQNVSNERGYPNRSQIKVPLPPGNGMSSFRSGAHEQATLVNVQSKFLHGANLNEVKVGPDTVVEQNRGPRTNRLKNQLVVKAYTRRAGDMDAQGNITIYTDQYNKDDFPVDYPNAKFFVIKSYSEDDVHKSIKYNVWSSTPNGNKKLNSAYEDAQRIAAGDSRGCPIFLFFSVNASGQFCGVAEMIGPVDFQKDMDFWQQDKWSGSFPVKWHIIKDLPNPNFRHIILENNENKPVTNSRDTQEIRFKKGIEMLRIFKGHPSKTSLLDDFIYYENRQKVLQEEKAKLFKTYGGSPLMPVLDPPRKLNIILDLPSNEDEKTVKENDSSVSEDRTSASVEQVPLDSVVSNSRSASENGKPGDKEEPQVNSILKIGSLTINSKQSEPQVTDAGPVSTAASNATETRSIDVVTVGSVPVKVNGFGDSSRFITVGTIAVDPRPKKREESSALLNTNPQKG